MVEQKKSLAVADVRDKFAFLLSSWIVTELHSGDVTVWTPNGVASCYIAFDPVSFRFFVRMSGEPRADGECVIGVQDIDFDYVDHVAASHIENDDPLVSGLGEDEAYMVTYAYEVLRYWTMSEDIGALLTHAISSLSEEETQQCLENIEKTYHLISVNQTEGDEYSMLFKVKEYLRFEAASLLGLEFLH